jgi:hypothetical protein
MISATDQRKTKRALASKLWSEKTMIASFREVRNSVVEFLLFFLMAVVTCSEVAAVRYFVFASKPEMKACAFVLGCFTTSWALASVRFWKDGDNCPTENQECEASVEHFSLSEVEGANSASRAISDFEKEEV